MKRLAGALLVVAPALFWSELAIDLFPQKALLVALGLPIAAASASALGVAFLAAGALAAAIWPGAPWEIAAVAAAPAVWAFFRDEPERWIPWVRRTALAVAALVLLQAAGVPLFEGAVRAFRLERVVTGPMGNPNHLATWLLLALPVTMWRWPEGRGARIETMVAGVAIALAVLLTGSGLGRVVLAVETVLLAPRPRLPVRLAVAAGLAIAVIAAHPRALAGRLYLHRVEATGLSARALLLGHGPGEHPRVFLERQAAWLAAHPEDEARFTNPEMAHDDLVQLAATWGLVACLAFAVLCALRLTIDRAAPPGPALAAAAAVALLAVGSSVILVPPAWTLAVLVAALTLRRRSGTPARPRLAVVLACLWPVLLGGQVVSGWARREATIAAQTGDDARARRRIGLAQALPFDRAQVEYLAGRIDLQAGRRAEAAAHFRRALELLPHPQIAAALRAAE